MATTRKTTKSTGGKRAASASSSRGGTRKAPSRSKKPQPQPRPVRREVGSVACLLLAVLTVLGGVGVNAIFLDFFCGLLKGMFGYGFWAVPVVLIGASGILLFHRGRPVRLRVACALALPLLVGAFLHLFLCRSTYEGLTFTALTAQLMREGCVIQSGGTVSGLLAIAFTRVFSKVGAALIFGVVFLALLLAAASLSIVDIVDWYRSRPRPEYEYEEEPEPVLARGGRRTAEPRPAPSPARRRAVIDIPVDDGPAAAGEETPKAPARKERLFNKQARVPRPDELLQSRAEPAPEPEAPKPVPEPAQEPEPEPVKPEEPGALPFDFPEQAKTALEEPVVPPEARNPIPTGKRELPEPAEEAEPAPEPLPPMPEIVREPAVPKRSKSEEAAAAAEEIAQSIEEGMNQDAPAAYRYPPLSLLKERNSDVGDVSAELRSNQERLEDTLSSFGIDARIIGAVRGPSATRYELELERGVKLNKVTNLAGDIALSLGASAVIIAPIPQRSSVLGIEVPNRKVTPVSLREVLDSPEFRNHSSKVAFAVGKDITNRCVVGNIAKLPHMLIAGTTGSGKSVCTNSLVLSLLYKATPEEVRLIIIDPKVVEFSVYNGIPHMLIPVVTDPKKAAGALQWAVTEMLKRYQTFAEVGVRDLSSYNELAARSEDRSRMPQIVIIIDELADLMTAAAKEVEESICRVAQMGRASGMHLIIATQRPSADVITGLMKANIPSRIGLKVDGAINSRIILDDVGAEKLVGYGDMLFKPVDAQKARRVQGCFVDDGEVHAVVNFIKQQGGEANYSNDVIKEIEQNVQAREKGSKSGVMTDPAPEDDADEMLPAAIDVVVETGMASVSMLQRRLKLGYSRAARLVDQMQDRGIVGPFEGSKPRQVLITKEQWAAQKMGPAGLDSGVPEELPYEDGAVEQGPPPFDP